jgi:hypothetical protein
LRIAATAFENCCSTSPPIASTDIRIFWISSSKTLTVCSFIVATAPGVLESIALPQPNLPVR